MDRNLGDMERYHRHFQIGTISGDRSYRVTRGKPSKLPEKIGISDTGEESSALTENVYYSILHKRARGHIEKMVHFKIPVDSQRKQGRKVKRLLEHCKEHCKECGS